MKNIIAIAAAITLSGVAHADSSERIFGTIYVPAKEIVLSDIKGTCPSGKYAAMQQIRSKGRVKLIGLGCFTIVDDKIVLATRYTDTDLVVHEAFTYENFVLSDAYRKKNPIAK